MIDNRETALNYLRAEIEAEKEFIRHLSSVSEQVDVIENDEALTFAAYMMAWERGYNQHEWEDAAKAAVDTTESIIAHGTKPSLQMLTPGSIETMHRSFLTNAELGVIEKIGEVLDNINAVNHKLALKSHWNSEHKALQAELDKELYPMLYSMIDGIGALRSAQEVVPDLDAVIGGEPCSEWDDRGIATMAAEAILAGSDKGSANRDMVKSIEPGR